MTPDQKFLLSADKEARHGDVVAVYAKLRTAGFQHLAVSISGDQKADSATASITANGTVQATITTK